jgi:spore maturation protein CgeB
MELLIVASAQRGHMGQYLASAAKRLGLDYHIMDSTQAEARSRIVRSLYWRLRGKRPARLDQFGAQVLAASAVMHPKYVLTTGCGRLNRSHVEGLRAVGATVINYSTDDPWNPKLKAPWFLRTLSSYNAVFTPRHANIDDFRRCGLKAVHYLPFGYDADVHRPWPESRPTAAPSDVLFVGRGDEDRVPLINSLIDIGLDLALFGGHWDRHAKTRRYWRGIADQETIRSASAAARICLCLTRRANRDGHTMRSFEAAAIGGCILVEDTADHRELFGPDDFAVRYFKTTPELVQQTKLLLADADARHRLSSQLAERFSRGKHTYADRLTSMLRSLNGGDMAAAN